MYRIRVINETDIEIENNSLGKFGTSGTFAAVSEILHRISLVAVSEDVDVVVLVFDVDS